METSDSKQEEDTKMEVEKGSIDEQTSKSEETIETSTEEEKSEVGFKKPLMIIGPKKVVHKFKPPESEDPPPVKKSSVPALQAYSDPHVSKEKLIPLPYSEPEWGGTVTSDNYYLEVLKTGVILETVQLNTKSFYVFGRLSSCDVQMNHPSSSRYHAILQYRAEPTEKSPKGFYIYDLGSTHGTFLNKNRLKPKVYAPVKVGQFFKIGGSSRMLFLQVMYGFNFWVVRY